MADTHSPNFHMLPPFFLRVNDHGGLRLFQCTLLALPTCGQCTDHRRKLTWPHGLIVGLGDDLHVSPMFPTMLLDVVECWEYNVVVQRVIERVRFSGVQPVLDDPEHMATADNSPVVSSNPNSCHGIKSIRLYKKEK